MARSKPSPAQPRPPTPAPDLSILGDSVTLQPGLEEPSLPSHLDIHGGPSSSNGADHPERNLVEHMARFRESPFEFLREIGLHVSGTGWRSYDNVVGQPVFYEGFSDEMKRAVMGAPMLKAKIEGLAEGRVEVEAEMGLFGPGPKSGGTSEGEYEKRRAQRKREIENSLTQVTERMTDDMICKMESKRFIRGAYYIATQLLTRAYHLGIHVSSTEVLRLRAVAEQAAKQRRSIIFLPNHRSHVDYVSLQLICYRLGLALPTVVAGDNLNFPLLGPFLQHAGAMWIRRSFGDDQLYVTLVQAYIDTLLQRGFNFECFIEGGRSRIGKLLPPKYGILSFLLDSVLSGRVTDAIVCPVSTQYDKVIEVDSYISELLGTPKPKENLYDFLSASSVLSLKLGRVDVRFHEPWSLRAFVDAQQTRFESLSLEQQERVQSTYDRDLRVRLLRTLGYKILSDINAVSVVMPTSLIGTVLLTLRGRGVGKTELIRRVEWLSDRVRAQGGRVAHFAGLPTKTVVERGLEVLGPKLVGVEKNLMDETYFAVDRFQLSFYRNMTIHLFISQSIVCASLYPRLKPGGPPENQATPYRALVSQVAFLSQLFRGEFIFPTQGLATNLEDTLNGLEADGVISIKRRHHVETSSNKLDGDEEVTAGGASAADTIEHLGLSDAERERGRENFDFYCFLVWPFIESSWLGAVSLLMLTPPAPLSSHHVTPTQGGPNPTKSPSVWWLPTRTLLSSAQLLGKTLYAQGDLSYFEAVNKETLKNALARFEEEGIVIVRKPAKGAAGAEAVEAVRLAAEWTPTRHRAERASTFARTSASGEGDQLDWELRPQGRLWDFCEEISRSRLEGKNRRDGDAANRRVLGLVEKLGFGAADVVAGIVEGGMPRDAGTVGKGKGEGGGSNAAEGGSSADEKDERARKKRSRGKMARL